MVSAHLHNQFHLQCQHIGQDPVFKSYNLIPTYSSKHCVNLMVLLQMTVNHSIVNNNVLSQFPSHEKDIYKLFMGGKHSIQTNLLVPTTFNIANIACISLDAYFDHVLGHGIPIPFAHNSITGLHLVGLHGSEQCWMVVNSILANVPDPANTSVMVGYLWSDGFQGTNTGQKNYLAWAMTVTLSLLPEHAHQNTTLVC